MDWQPHARDLAERVTPPGSRWRPVLATVARHRFVPRWWGFPPADGPRRLDRWLLRDGPQDETAWLNAAYSNDTLVTRVGTLHADQATPEDQPHGLPTSSSTMPGLLVQMYHYLDLADGHDVLDVGTGTGYGCALLATRAGDQHVTSVDVDEYLTSTAQQRLAAAGLRPRVITADATGPLPGSYDRIVATVAVRPVPASWLAALRPGGRLVTTIAGTMLILTADKTDDGGADGWIEADRAGFMVSRSGPDYPPSDVLSTAFDAVVGESSRGRHAAGWHRLDGDLWCTAAVLAPGLESVFSQDGETRMVYLAHPDGSWARAAGFQDERPDVQQGGPRRLWDLVDQVRDDELRVGKAPVAGAQARVRPDGVIELTQGRWRATVAS
jgi:protein-L-isoaspartate O-methyltransferase